MRPSRRGILLLAIGATGAYVVLEASRPNPSTNNDGDTPSLNNRSVGYGMGGFGMGVYGGERS